MNMEGGLMDINEIGAALVAGCNAGQAKANLRVLYADDAQSVEAADMGNGTTVTGIAAIEGKHDWWDGAHETHSSTATGPFMHGADRFAVIFAADATTKETGVRFSMQEVGVYTVAGGKIVREEFFYGA
jgi:ketosteroid isomerase-like protein